MMWAALWSYRHAFSFHPLCVPVWRRRPWLFVEGTRLASCDWTTGHPGSQAGAASPDSKPAKSIKREKPPFKWPWMLAEKRFLFLVIVLYTLFFFQFFFLMWTVFKVYIELITILLSLHDFWSFGHETCRIPSPQPGIEPPNRKLKSQPLEPQGSPCTRN